MTFHIYQYEKRGLTFTVYGPDNTPFDLAGFQVEWRARCKDYVIIKTLADGIAIDDPTTGRLLVSLYPDDLTVFGKYDMELRITDPDISVTVLREKFEVLDSLMEGEP